MIRDEDKQSGISDFNSTFAQNHMPAASLIESRDETKVGIGATAVDAIIRRSSST
jgi:hypothetical protein